MFQRPSAVIHPRPRRVVQPWPVDRSRSHGAVRRSAFASSSLTGALDPRRTDAWRVGGRNASPWEGTTFSRQAARQRRALAEESGG